jgi:hypothetical protein
VYKHFNIHKSVLPYPVENKVNVPVVNIARDKMILMRANLFCGPLEGVDPEKQDFLGPKMATSEARCHLAL